MFYIVLHKSHSIVLSDGDEIIRHVKFTDEFLLQHLRTRKFNVAKCLKAITQFICLTQRFPEMFTDFCFDTTVRGVRDGIVTFLPWRCQDGCIILYVQISKCKMNFYLLSKRQF